MGLLSGLFGDDGAGARLNEANQVINSADAPTVDEQKLLLQQYVEQGVLTPEQAQAYLVQSNGYDSMDLDSQGKDAQMSALLSLQDIANDGGLNATDKSKLQAIQNDEQTQSRGAREAILNNAQARGAGGSGLEMLAQLQGAQDSATRQSARDTDVAAQARAEALQALQGAGTLGGQINQQQFGQQQAIADSKNEIAKFNAANSQQVGLANAEANNAAQAQNLAAKQAVANSNVEQSNQAQQYNKELLQKNFQNQITKGQAMQGAATAQGNAANASNQQAQNLIGTGLGAAATVFGGPVAGAATKKKVSG